MSLFSSTWDLFSAFLLLGILLTVTVRANLTGWTEALVYLPVIVFWSTLLGYLLGMSRFRRKGIALLVAGYSAIALPHFYLYLIEMGASLPLFARLNLLGWHLNWSLQLFFRGEPLTDPLLFTILGYTLFWLLGLWCGFVWTRHHHLWAVLTPPSLVLTALYSYDPVQPAAATLWFYLLLVALLIARHHARQSQASWQQRGTVLHSEAVHDLGVSAFRVSLLVLLLAWLIPWVLSPASPVQRAWEQLRKAWEPTRERLSNIVEPLQRRGGGSPMPRRLSLGLESARGEDVVFTVQVPTEAQVTRYYWREQVFDRFEGDFWSASPTEEVAVPPLQDLPTFLPARGRELRASFELQRYSPWLYLFATPRSVNVPVRLSGFRIGVASLDVLTLQAMDGIERGARYVLQARYITPSIEELREAEGDIPRWVLDRYLQLPENFSPRLRELAQAITATAPTRYDKAEAITRYLRENIAYAERIPPPPTDRDVMEWFLFEHRQGFCNYYASAEVLLLRAVGVPARLATGYAQGEFAGDGRYIIRARHAHAWPEVYFPGWGWVEFEPTVSQAALVRPSRPVATATQKPISATPVPEVPHTPRAEPEEETAPVGQKSVGWLLFGGVFVLVLFFIIIRRYIPKGNFPLYLQKNLGRYGLKSPKWLRDWARWSGLSSLERSFEEINRSLQRLGVHVPASATPAERAQRLIEALPEAREAIEELLAEYQAAVYGKVTGHVRRAQRAAQHIRYAAWKRRYFHFM